jgi:hypothetical protein
MREHELPIESRESPALFPPATESLVNLELAEKNWPKEVTENPEFREQVAFRQKLIERLDAVLRSLPQPDMELDKAVEEGRVKISEASDLYESLAELLSDPEYGRLALYLPFELLPAVGKMRPYELDEAAANFQRSYMDAWAQLLSSLDVRANFVDGDVLEAESRQGDHPRLVKAAHLIPKLIEKGYLDPAGVIEMIEKNSEPTLLSSIADTLPMLAEMKVMDKTEIERLRALIPASSQKNQEPPNAVTEARTKWIESEKRRLESEKAGDELLRLIDEKGEISDFEIKILAIAVRKAIDRGTDASKDIFERYSDALHSALPAADAETKDEIEKALFHAAASGVADKSLLERHGLTVPKLAGPFSENLHTNDKDMEDIGRAVSAMEKNPELSALAYPLLLIYGSRLKGYATSRADRDVAYLLRPGLSPADAEHARELIAKNAFNENTGEELTEFRTQQTPEGIRIDDRKVSLPHAGDSAWAHVLFGAAWEGDPQTVQKLRSELLTPYFFIKTDDVEKRKQQLWELERDALQYRLMHRGYARFNTPCGGFNSPAAASIDGQSAFWDSGYRRTATRIFARRVFLPKLKK